MKQLVSLMGGRIGVDSTPGLGSRFWVEVGMSVSEDTGVEFQGPSQLAASSASLQGVRVLVTDDSGINLEVARRILQSEGAQVSVASNGQEAVDWLLADPEGADVVLMDVQMPVLDGHDATRRIRSGLGLAQLPIIALTAGITTGEYERARAAGMNDVVAKPFDPPDLILAIRRHLPAAALGEATSAPKSPTHSQDWPEIEGIDTGDVRSRLGSDIDLFRSMLRRLVSEFSDLVEPAAHVDGKALAGRLHNLKGSAGTLGAKLIERLAADAEQACVSNDARRLDSLARQLGAEIVNLGARASSILQVDDDAYEFPRGHLDSQALADLVKQLQQFDLAAIDGFKILAPHLRALLGAEAFARIKEQIDELRFTEAALALSVIVS